MGRISSAVLLIALFFVSCGKAAAHNLVIFKSQDYVSRSYQVQNFQDTLTLKAGEMTLPLEMTICNGSPETPSFKWFRIIINGEVIATEKDLNGKELGSKDISGLLSGSDLQVQVQSGGVPGANLWWYLSAPQMQVSYARPQQAQAGSRVRIFGNNFPSDPKLLSVTINDRAAQVISANSNCLEIELPSDSDTGVNRLTVRSGDQSSNAISFIVASRPLPEILGIDCWMAPPGGTIHISGRNFSVNTVSNKVFFGQVQGEVTACSSEELTVTVPNWSYGPSQLNIPVSVDVDGVRSANSYPFDIGPSYHGAVPQFVQD